MIRVPCRLSPRFHDGQKVGGSFLHPWDGIGVLSSASEVRYYNAVGAADSGILSRDASRLSVSSTPSSVSVPSGYPKVALRSFQKHPHNRIRHSSVSNANWESHRFSVLGLLN